MSTEIILTPSEFAGLGANINEARFRLIAAGYANPGVCRRGSNMTGAEEYVVRVDDDGVAKAQLIDALDGIEATRVTIDPSQQTILGDGSQLATFQITGPADHELEVRFGGVLPISATAVTLDANGRGVLIVGPFPAGHKSAAAGLTFSVACGHCRCFEPITCRVIVS